MKHSEVNNGFGELPKLRGFGSLIGGVATILIYILIVLSYRSHNNFSDLWGTDDIGVICGVTSAILLGEFLRTLILFIEERNHVSSRYCNSTFKTFSCCIPYSTTLYGLCKVAIFVISSVGTAIYWKFSTNTTFHWSMYTAVAVFNSLNQVILSKAEVSHLNETENKHVADGLAWSFYFGYLKLMLPCLDGMLSEAVKNNGYAIGDIDLRDKLCAHKVFIVIPKDCYTYESFTDADPRITKVTNMPPKIQSRGGVQERVYKNSVWKIQITNEAKDDLYIMLEYATPCLSMYDMSKQSNSKFTKDDLESQVKEFSSKLKRILEDDPECRGKYELVLCGDVKSRKLGDIINESVMKEGRVDMQDQ